VGAADDFMLDEPVVSKSGPVTKPTGKPAPAGPAYLQGARQSDSPWSACLLRFKGSSVRCVGAKGPNHGQADVFVDGKAVRTIDTYAPALALRQTLFELGGLDTQTVHEVRIVVKRERNPKTKDGMVIVEGFDVPKPFNYTAWLVEQGEEEMARIVSGDKAYLKPDQWKPVPFKAQAPLGGVTLDGGPLRRCFDLNTNYLGRCFAATKQYKGPNPGMGWDGHLPGSGDGKMLGGAAHTLRWGENADMRAIVDAVVAVVKKRQREDGYCMSFPEENMKPTRNAWHDERRNYARVHLTRGMVAAAQVGNPDALPIMREFYDWLYASPYCATLLSGPFNGSAHNCNNGHEGSLLMYFSPAGKPEDLVAVERYFVQDFFIEESRKQDPLSLCYYPYHVPHSYVLLAYKAWLEHYRATGAEKYLDAAKGAWQMLNDNYIHIGGSLAICEAGPGSYPPGSYLLEKRNHTGETCGSVFWMDINHRLLQFFPDEAKYADAMEATMINVMQAVQDETGNIRYHTALVDQKHDATFQNTCCEVFGSPFFGRIPEFLYSVAPDGLYVNLYAPSTIKWKQGSVDAALATVTEYPFNGKVEMKVSASAPVAMSLRVRVPGWVGGEVAIAVNGKTETNGRPRSFVTLNRTWKDGDRVSFELPMTLRTEVYTGVQQDPEHDRYALLYGPVLLALMGAKDLDIPAAELPARLQPEEGKPLNFTVRGLEGVRYQPYWPIQKEPFTCFPTMR
jgi:DUF1680 family protein